jgi:hypothetical protein
VAHPYVVVLGIGPRYNYLATYWQATCNFCKRK